MRWALAVFVVAGLTDLLDGLIARWGEQQTTLGAMLDPVADKMLLTSCFVALTWGPGLRAPLPVWLTVVDAVAGRDHHDQRGRREPGLGRRVFYPSLLGKLATLSQIVTVGVVLLLNALGWTFPVRVYVFLVDARPHRGLRRSTTCTWPPPGGREAPRRLGRGDA